MRYSNRDSIGGTVVGIPGKCEHCKKPFIIYSGERICLECRARYSKHSRKRPVKKWPISITGHLSPREVTLVGRVMMGDSNKEIGAQLGLTIGSVKERLFFLYKKTGVSNRVGLAMWGRDRRDAQEKKA